jgi:hypothetical protein
MSTKKKKYILREMLLQANFILINLFISKYFLYLVFFNFLDLRKVPDVMTQKLNLDITKTIVSTPMKVSIDMEGNKEENKLTNISSPVTDKSETSMPSNLQFQINPIKPESTSNKISQANNIYSKHVLSTVQEEKKPFLNENEKRLEEFLQADKFYLPQIKDSTQYTQSNQYQHEYQNITSPYNLLSNMQHEVTNNISKILYHNDKYKIKLKNIFKFNIIENMLKRTFYNKWKSNILISKKHETILKKLRTNRLYRLLYSFKENCDDRKWNKYYIREVIKSKLGVLYYDGFNENQFKRIDKNKFYSYKDIKNNLCCKLEEEILLSAKTTNTLEKKPLFHHLKILIITEKNILLQTKILDHLLNFTDENIEIEQGEYFINLIDKNNFTLNSQPISIFFNILLLDKIEINDYILTNLNSIEKYAYCLVYLDYRNFSSIENLMTILDYQIKYIKKDILLLNFFEHSFNSLDIEEYNNNINLLEERYKCQITKNTIFYQENAEVFYSDVLEYYNNSEFFSVFDEYIKIQNFIPYEIVKIDFYISHIKFYHYIFKYLNRKKSFVSDFRDEINYPQWTKFFIHVI